MNQPSLILAKAIEGHEELRAQDRALLSGIAWRIKDYGAEDEIVRHGTQPVESCVLIEGFAGRSHILADGRRQISNIHVAGDFVDLHSIVLKVMDHSVVALTACTVGFVRHEVVAPCP